jgi:hypothetical protein
MTYRHKRLTDEFHLPIRYNRNTELHGFDYYIDGLFVFTACNEKTASTKFMTYKNTRKDHWIGRKLIEAQELFDNRVTQ